MVKIFSDGACLGNPGPGSYGTLIQLESGEELTLSGFSQQTTNNKMEMMGVIAGLSHFKTPITCSVTTDSQYVSKGMTEWLPKWVQNNWRSKVSRAPIKNKELWEQIHELLQFHQIHVYWTRGHVGHPENERCHELAQEVLQKRNLI